LYCRIVTPNCLDENNRFSVYLVESEFFGRLGFEIAAKCAAGFASDSPNPHERPISPMKQDVQH
jgi:hypothetical protein